MKKVYIASPYTGKDPLESVRNQIIAGNMLLNSGFNPFVPLLSHYLHVEQNRSNEDWLNILTQWLEDCDYLLRLPGESEGADEEIQVATVLNIPVFYSIEDLLAND